MKLLCTGGSGLIGSSFLRKYNRHFNEIFCLGRSENKEFKFLNQDLKQDIQVDLPAVDVVLHTAAQTSAHVAWKEPISDLEINVGGLIRIIENYRKRRIVPFILFLGNATQIGMTHSVVEAKDKKCDQPITFYDLSKNTAEKYLLQYINAGLIQGCSLRLCNVYGTAGNRQNSDRGILDKMMKRALKGNDLTLYGDGSYIRDYIHLDDVAGSIIAAVNSREKLNGQIHVIGSGVGTTLRKAFEIVVDVAAKVIGQRVGINSAEPPENLSEIEFRSYVADSTEFRKVTGWQPKLCLKEGLELSYL